MMILKLYFLLNAIITIISLVVLSKTDLSKPHSHDDNTVRMIEEIQAGDKMMLLVFLAVTLTFGVPIFFKYVVEPRLK